MERLHILDGYGYIFRAHYGLVYAGKNRQGVRLTTQDGRPTGALYVYASMLIRLHLDVHPERIAVVFDAPGETFRDFIDEEYKANREEMPDDLREQMPHFRPLTEAFSWPVVAVPGVEADDVIATLVDSARARDWDVVIYSADKDLMQLVDDRVQVIDSMRQRVYDTDGVVAKFGVPPHQVAEWLALVGDTSDNIPGVAGVGPKTAAKLLTEYGNIDAILEHSGDLKGKMRERFQDPEQLERLERSRKLVALKRDVELPCELEELVAGPWDEARLRDTFGELEFHALLERLEAKSGAAGKGSGGPKKTTDNDRQSEAGDGDDAEPMAAAEIAETDVAGGADDVAAWVTAAVKTGRVAIQVEMDGQRPDRARCVGMALAAPGCRSLYLSFGHRYLGAPAPLGKAAIDALRPLSSGGGVEVVCHNAKGVYKVFAALGLERPKVSLDTMLAAYLLDASRDSFDLESIASEMTGTTLPPRKSLLGSGKKAIQFESLAVEVAADDSGRRAGAVLAAAARLENAIGRAELGGLLADLELPLAELLSRIEQRGICLDVAHLRALSERVGAQVAALERKAHDLAGEQFNLGSPKQLAALLFDRLGLKSERMKKTKTGYSTDHEVLEAMLDAHPIVAPILEHRELVKLKGTYIDALPPLVNPDSGRLHTVFRQAVAATGRLSSVDPNLQNIPVRTELGREIRRAFVAPDGKLLVSADYSQIELRVLAHLSGDPVLVKAFNEDLDVHTQTAAEVFGIDGADVGASERRVAKAVNYGLVYGQSDFGLARALEIPRHEARHYIDRYFERFSTVAKFMEELVSRARKAGASYTVLGRRRPVPGLTSRNYRVRSAAERVAQNTPMQGSGADIMKLAMLNVDRWLGEQSFDADILLTVHDELLFEVDAEQAEEFAAAVRGVMESAYALNVPLKVDVGTATNWAEAH